MPKVKLDPKMHGDQNGVLVLDYRFVSPRWDDDRYYEVIHNGLAVEMWAMRLKSDRLRCRTKERSILVKIQKRSVQ